MTKMARTAALCALLLLGALPAAAQNVLTDSLLVRANQSRILGSETAPITIIELADFQCPYCRDVSREGTLAAIDSAFVKTGRARVVFYNFPLLSHPRAWIAAEAALCAGAQDRFWPMHDRLFAEQAAWGASAQPGADFDGYAAAIGLDVGAFRECVRDDRVAPLIMADLIQGIRGGAAATPTFVVLRAPRPGETPDAAQRTLAGAQPFAEFAKAIEELSR